LLVTIFWTLTSRSNVFFFIDEKLLEDSTSSRSHLDSPDAPTVFYDSTSTPLGHCQSECPVHTVKLPQAYTESELKEFPTQDDCESEPTTCFPFTIDECMPLLTEDAWAISGMPLSSASLAFNQINGGLDNTPVGQSTAHSI
jgi:hypothetical protein